MSTSNNGLIVTPEMGTSTQELSRDGCLFQTLHMEPVEEKWAFITTLDVLGCFLPTVWRARGCHPRVRI